MSNPRKLKITEARQLILHAAGLSKRAQFGRGKEAVYKFIDHLGFVQLDTNFVVERAHHHAIAARVPGYELKWLKELQDEARIFEYWTFASGFMPMYEFRFSLPVKKAMAARWKPPTSQETAMIRKVLNRISREGPLMARDFEYDRVVKSKGWWDWRPSKLALERLFFDGTLTALRRADFQKVYDLTSNVIPVGTDTTPPTAEEFARHVIKRALQSMGIVTQKDLRSLARYVKGNCVKAELQRMAVNGEVETVEIEGLKSQEFYLSPKNVNKRIRVERNAHILSPFDHLNVFRHRLKDFFSFDYQVECFVPAPKRKYGYFALPILVGDRFAARMDSKADRKTRTLIIHNLHFEGGSVAPEVVDSIAEAIGSFAKFNQCDSIVISKTNRKQIAEAILATTGN
jgi:uncharacterized protein YcaQ